MRASSIIVAITKPGSMISNS